MQNAVHSPDRNRDRFQKSRTNHQPRAAKRQEPQAPVQFPGLATVAVRSLPALASLPILPSHIPTEYVIPSGLVESADVALDMLAAGVLTDTVSLLPAQMIQNSMKAWFASITKGLTTLEPHLVMSNNLHRLEDGLDEDTAKEQFKLEEEKCLSFGVMFNEWEWFTLKEKIEALEAKVAGLGETAIDRLDGVLQSCCQAVTPNFTFYCASSAYWLGEDDEELVLEEYGDCGAEPDEVDVMRRAEFNACFPELSYKASAKLDTAALTSLLSHSDLEVAELAALLLEVDADDGHVDPVYPQMIAEDHLPTLYPAVCVAWAEDDLTVQIIDDYFNREGENGGTQFHNFWMFPQSAEGVLAAKSNIEKYVKRLMWGEKLLFMIATKTENI